MPMPNGSMPRKRKRQTAPGGKATRRQYNVGVSPAVAARIDATADALGLDATQLLRMIVHEHLPDYEARAKAARDAAPPAAE